MLTQWIKFVLAWIKYRSSASDGKKNCTVPSANRFTGRIKICPDIATTPGIAFPSRSAKITFDGVIGPELSRSVGETVNGKFAITRLFVNVAGVFASEYTSTRRTPGATSRDLIKRAGSAAASDAS